MTCNHHWEIAPPEGPTSEGVCLKCGMTKPFPNYLPFKISAQRKGTRPVDPYPIELYSGKVVNL